MLVPFFFLCQIVFSLQQMSLFTARLSNSSFSKKSIADVAQNILAALFFLKLLKFSANFYRVHVNLSI